MRSNHFDATRARVLRGVLLGAMLLAGAVQSTQAGGGCVAVQLASPFLLPDGSLHPAGKLTLCTIRDYSPIQSFPELRVNGVAVGYVIGLRRGREGPPPADPLVYFRKTAAGELALIGYTAARGSKMITHVLDRDPRLMMASRERTAPDPSWIVVAAMRD